MEKIINQLLCLMLGLSYALGKVKSTFEKVKTEYLPDSNSHVEK